MLLAFVRIERSASEPILPLTLVRSRGVGIPTLGMLIVAAGLFATLLFTPLFVQGVIGSSATRSGSVVAPMTLALVAGSVLIGQLIARIQRYRVVGILGLIAAASGEWLMSGMGVDTDYATVARNLVIVGFGLGTALTAFAIASQNAVDVAQMGVATGLGTSGRAIGGTLGSAGFGSSDHEHWCGCGPDQWRLISWMPAGSSPLVGSSRMSSSGSTRRDSARPSRWRMPCE